MPHTPALVCRRVVPSALTCLALLSLALLGMASAGPVRAELRHYRLDPVHTRIAFQVSHAGFSNPIGSFSKATGTLDFDADDWSTARVSVEVPIATLDLGDAGWQGKILDSTFFDSGKFPTARFVSTKVERGAGNHARVTGELTLHGVTAPLVLEVELNALKRHPLTFHRTAGFSAKGTLSRKAFGMDHWERVVGDAVTLVIEAEALVEGKDPQAASEVAPSPATGAAPVDKDKDIRDDGRQH